MKWPHTTGQLKSRCRGLSNSWLMICNLCHSKFTFNLFSITMNPTPTQRPAIINTLGFFGQSLAGFLCQTLALDHDNQIRAMNFENSSAPAPTNKTAKPTKGLGVGQSAAMPTIPTKLGNTDRNEAPAPRHAKRHIWPSRSEQDPRDVHTLSMINPNTAELGCPKTKTTRNHMMKFRSLLSPGSFDIAASRELDANAGEWLTFGSHIWILCPDHLWHLLDGKRWPLHPNFILGFSLKRTEKTASTLRYP